MTGPAAPRPHAVPAPAALRSLRRRVTAWALATRHPVDRDALAAVLGARHAATGGQDAPWTAADVGALLWVGVAEWCRSVGVDLPDATATRATVLTLLSHLAEHRGLPPGSDPPAVLRQAVAEYSGGGRSSRHPAVSARRPAPVVPIG